MKINTNELIGPALDWAVANAQGIRSSVMVEVDCGQAQFRPLERWCAINVTMAGHEVFDPSADWAQGGPIIDREGIGFHRNGKRTYSSDAMRYEANVTRNQDDAPICRVGYRALGPTPLVAAMRCYVMSKLGIDVDVPEELL